MSASTADLTRNCKRCSRELPPGALDCPGCHALVHEEQLERITARARAYEANGGLWDAREQWQSAVKLLPSDSKQAEWIRRHIRELEITIHAPGAPDTRKKWAKWLAPLGPLAIILAKGKTILLLIFKLKFLVSFGAFIVIYWQLYGAWFGIGFAVMILIHEMGHFIDVKRRGLPAEMPVFLPGLGAYVKWQAMGVSLETRAAVSLAGPLAGWLAAGVAGLIYYYTGNGLWAALARSGAWLNIINLAPVWILDGGQAVLAINKIGRAVILATSVALAAAFEEWVLLLVAAGFVYRLFTKDEPAKGSANVTLYYAVVLAGLAFTMRLMPGAGFGR